MNAKPLRVLHVLGELKPSGAETMLVSAAALFQKEGIELEVLSTGAVTGPYATRFEASGFCLHHIPFARTPFFFLKVMRLMQTGRYDVIHLHVEAANFWYGLSALAARPAAILRTVHNAFTFAGNLQWRRGIQRRLLHRLGIRHVAISESVSKTEQRHFGIATSLIWNWYDSQRFVVTSAKARFAARAGFGLKEHEFVIVSIGNCSKVKNHTSVIQALASMPADRCPIYIHAGIEESSHPERLLAQQLGIAERIRFLGGCADVLPLLQAADAFVMPSLYEGFGIAAIEALATGLPALFSDVNGLRDFRTDFPYLEYTGTRPEEIAAGLERLMRMPPARRTEIRQIYPAIALQRFGKERGVKEYLTLYRELVSMSRLAGRVNHA